MNIWHDIRKERVTAERFVAVIEITKGSQKKYEMDKETGLLVLDRVLHTSTHYPANYGFLPLTYADDNDPLDVLVLCSEPLEGMTLVECYPIGAVRMIDDGKNDDKVIAIPFGDPTWNHYKDIKDLPPHIVSEMMHFFAVYKSLEHKTTGGIEMLQKNQAIDIIKKSLVDYKAKFGKK
ncbi:MAG: inorganic diphosphatase [Firmicutes bacterium]|nr:inorganic diphosphatase [Bacillota bacterium]